MEKIQTVIVGAGQAGLATSYYLTKENHEHIVLEQSEIPASAWHTRWDSLTLVTPNSVFRVPGIAHDTSSPDGFMPRHDVLTFFERYVRLHNLPLKYNTRVISISQAYEDGYIVQTGNLTYHAQHVIIATGFSQHPKIPTFASNVSFRVHQLHSSRYRNPGLIPDGAVQVVGSGQSGTQIAEELYKTGRKVFLSVGTAGRAPRRYRGRDIITWLELIGLFDLTPEQLPPGMGKFDGIPHLSGTNGGHTLNLHQFAHDGVTLLGHVRDADNEKLSIADDLFQSLEAADQFEKELVSAIDEYIDKNEIDAPSEQLPNLSDGFQQDIITELDLKKENINTIIWAIGYTFDYSLVKLPVLDRDGFPLQSRGVTNFPGLYFAGQPWMPTEKSGFFPGLDESARYIAQQILQAVTASEK